VLRGFLSEAWANLLYYAVGFLYMLLAAFGFLRRDFDPLVDAPLRVLLEVLRCYASMLACNLLLALLYQLLPEADNPNNARVMEVVVQDRRVMNASLIYLTPLVEELMFRAGIFGLLRKKNRRAAYIVSALCFSIYHVAPYALQAPVYWIFLIQYLPVSLLLAWCYERCNTIWASIFFHMLVNGVSLSALSTLM
jgi:CAAX amino terminal protease family.